MDATLGQIQPELWFQELVSLADDCSSGSGEPPGIVRRFATLIEHSPEGAGNLLHRDYSARALERKIERHCLLDAAMTVVGIPHGLMLSRSPGGRAMASVALPESSGEASMTSDDLATAYCGALAVALFRSRATELH